MSTVCIPNGLKLQLYVKVFIVHFPHAHFCAKCWGKLGDEKDPGLVLRELTIQMRNGTNIYASHTSVGGCRKAITEAERNGEIHIMEEATEVLKGS